MLMAERTPGRTIGRACWTDHLHMEAADAEMAFDRVWVECRAVPGYDPLTVAILEANESPTVEDHPVPAGYTTFLKVAQSLQRQLPTSSYSCSLAISWRRCWLANP